ncbi:hypothetical protein Ddye_016515 [Dipteronia dyeriana]|uniref:Agenet domain-containing protein n=1 Tax=Dipteronia dyeriana TaxID=168575 RepID=A0AAD9U7J7_9ROSI|nr:hypothetical protein Ddye_016515 [Dipteronia dyeriana]
MDYDDNEFQNQNLQLAGEGSTKFPPDLRPYALPKFDFDDGLHGHLRFDSLVETEVFLGIESNEDNQWIEDFSRGSSGIEFRTTAAESCSISRHNNVWSEAASSESVEMLLKSVGQEDNIPGKTIARGSDACDELGCLIKQMDPGSKHADDSLSKSGDVINARSTLPSNEILVSFSELKEDVGEGQPPVAVASQRVEGGSSVDGGLTNPVADSVSGMSSLPLTEGSSIVDQRKIDTFVESPNNGTGEDSSALGTHIDGLSTCPHNITISSVELNKLDALNLKSDISENVDDFQTDDGGELEEHPFVQEAEMNKQNLDENVVESGTHDSGNPLCLVSRKESKIAGNGIEVSTVNVEETSNRILNVDSDLDVVEGLTEDIQAGKCENRVLLEDVDIGDPSIVNMHEVSHENVFERPEIEVSNLNDSEASLLPMEDNKVSKAEVDGSSSSHVGDFATANVECSTAERLRETQLTVASLGDNVASGVSIKASNVDVNVPSFIPPGSSEILEEVVVSSQSDVHKSDQGISVEVKESTGLPSDCGNRSYEVAGNLIIGKRVWLSSLGEGITKNELMVSKPLPDSTTGHELVEGVHLHSKNTVAANAATVHQDVQTMDACHEENQGDPQGVLKEVSEEHRNGMEECTFVSDPKTVVGDDFESQVVSEKHEEVTVKESYEKSSSKVPDAESDPRENEFPAQPLPSPSEEICCDAGQNGQEVNKTTSVSGDKKDDGQIAVASIDGEPCVTLKVNEDTISSPPLSESNAKHRVLESGSSCLGPDEPSCGSPTIISATQLSLFESEKKGIKGSTDPNVPNSGDIDGDAGKVCYVSPDSKGNDASKCEKNFTFEVSTLAASPAIETGKNWQPFTTIQARKVSPIVEGSPSTSGVAQLNPKAAQDVSHGSLQVSNREIGRSGTKGTSERKNRRASTKAAGKESAKKGNTVKDTAAVRQPEKGEKTSNASLIPSGIFQRVQSNEMQHYGHVDCSSMKPFGVLTTSTSTLPDLNTSSSTLFHQPFTDLQQVQLRAQIFVYGALIQGSAPDEAYMISAFGGPDGGKSIWEAAWRACMERLHGQKSLLNNTETPMQSRLGARAPDQAIKHGAIQGKVASSPLGRISSKGTPSPIVNPMIPLSSPLWSIPTPSSDTLQTSGMPRGSVMDYQQTPSPLHPLQTPPVRNFVGHNTSWISQSPFRATWVPSPQTSAFDTSALFPVLPITETVQLTPVKEPSLPHPSGVKPISSAPLIHSLSPANVLSVTSPILDPKKVTVSAGEHSTDPKSRKRKKNPVSEASSQIKLHPQFETEMVSAPIVTSHMSTSVSITTPASLVSKVSSERVIMPISPTISTDHILKGEQEMRKRANLSEETLTKLKEARTQAEDASVSAAAAVSYTLEIWNQLDRQKDSGLVPDVESKLASAAVMAASATAVARAAAAAANVASNAALQAKLMAEEALNSSGYSNSSENSGTSLFDSMKNLGKATPASILKGENVKSSSSSIIFAAREAARRNVEAASAASKRAENMDAIVKAAELAAEAVSQAGKIVAMGDPLSLSDLIEAGMEGYLRAPQSSAQGVAKSADGNGGKLNIDSVRESPDTSVKHLKEVPLDSRKTQTTNQEMLATSKELLGESIEDHARLVSLATSVKNTKGHRGDKASDLAKTIGAVPESENGSRSSSITLQIEHEKEVNPLKENSIQEGSHVEVFKEGPQFKAAWFTANVLSLKDGTAYVCYTELPSDEGSEKLKEWVALKGEVDKAPKIRIARPMTVLPFEGTRKRRRAAMAEYTWSVGDRVDAWKQDSWWEGVVTEKSQKDETTFTVHFQAQGETAAVRAWHLRPSLIWKDGEWVESSSSTENSHASHEVDTRQEKRLRMNSPAVEAKGKDKISKGIGAVESGKPDEPRLLDLCANEKVFKIGKSTIAENKPETLRMIRTGLQKEGSRVVFGVPKPGKKRKFMEVSKHYVVDQGSKVNEANDSVKFTKYLMPQGQGSGSRGWKNVSRSDPKEKRAALSKPKVLRSGKLPSVSGRTIPQKDNVVNPAVSVPDDGAAIDHMEKIKDSAGHLENASEKHNLMEFRSLSSSKDAAEGPIQFSSMPLTSNAPSKKVSASNPRTERVTKGKLAPAGGRLTKIEEDKVFNTNSAKSSSEVVEPRRSIRRIQPTSRLLEGLQSSLIISKIPSASHDKSHKNQNRATTSRGNNHG